jgi:hypothetical protein
MAATNSGPDDESEPPTFSTESHEMLRILGKNHLRDVTNEEWSRYCAGRYRTAEKGNLCGAGTVTGSCAFTWAGTITRSQLLRHAMEF